MSDTTTVDESGDAAPRGAEPGSEDLPELEVSESLGAGGEGAHDVLKNRFLLPILVPALAIAVVLVLVLNISRVFLAGDSDAALVMGIMITVSILVGASIIAALPKLRTSTLALILGLVLVFVTGAGLVALGPSLNDSEGNACTGYCPPTGPAVGAVAVDAGPGLSFNGVKFTGNYTAPKAGVIQINYGGDAGHTLAIQGTQFDGFQLSSGGSPRSGKVDLKPGTYTIFCTVPGHEAAGMKATITVP